MTKIKPVAPDKTEAEKSEDEKVKIVSSSSIARMREEAKANAHEDESSSSSEDDEHDPNHEHGWFHGVDRFTLQVTVERAHGVVQMDMLSKRCGDRSCRLALSLSLSSPSPP